MNAIAEDANITEEAIKYIACPTCKQPAGELCVALVSRKPVLLVHDARAAVLRRAWWAGYAEGCKQAKASRNFFDCPPPLPP